MNPTIVLHTAMQRAFSPVRMLVVLSTVVFPMLILAAAPMLGTQALQSGALFGIVFGAGLIGQEVSAGVLQLLFARPVSRGEYVLSRWLGAAACASAAVVLQVALGSASLALRGAAPPIDSLAITALEQLLTAVGIVSVLTLFSCVLPGLGDVLGWFAMVFVAGGVQLVGMVVQRTSSTPLGPIVARTGQEISGFLNPTIHVAPMVQNGVAWFPIVSYASTVTLCLALAIVLLNRRELSYATD